MARAFIPQIATGNDLFQGDVVYFTAKGTWSRHQADSAVADTEETAATLLSKANKFPNAVVGVYLADVAFNTKGDPIPTHFREEFRTRGPSNYLTHGKQAEG